MSEFKDTIKGKPIHSLVIISVFAITVFLRFFYISNDYFHPDEVITTRVVEYMEQTGDYDTNWRKADLPPSFKYDQYNFSSYISSVYLFSRLIGSSNMFTYRVFSVICSSTIFIILLLLAHKTKEKLVYLYTAFLTAIAPILVQDAHYARPEAFASLLTLCVIYLCWPRKEPRLYSSYMAAILIGFLVACKISMAFFVWLPFIPAYDGLKRKKCIPVSRMFLFVVTVVILTILGFFIGVPRALKNPEAYIHGVQELLHQYDGLHPGHSHLAGGSVADLLFGYLGTTLGWAMMVFFVVGCLSKLGERAWDIIVLIYFPSVFYIGYFSLGSVFFERNISHIIPLVIIGSVYGLKTCYTYINKFLPSILRWNRFIIPIVLLFVSLTPMYYSYRLVFDVFGGKDDERRNDFHEYIIDTYKPQYEWEGHLLSKAPFTVIDEAIEKGDSPIVLRVFDLGDDITRRFLMKLYDKYNIRDIGSFDSLFKSIPHCTLHSYHSWTDRYFLVSGFR